MPVRCSVQFLGECTSVRSGWIYTNESGLILSAHRQHQKEWGLYCKTQLWRGEERHLFCSQLLGGRNTIPRVICILWFNLSTFIFLWSHMTIFAALFHATAPYMLRDERPFNSFPLPAHLWNYEIRCVVLCCFNHKQDDFVLHYIGVCIYTALLLPNMFDCKMTNKSLN